MTRRRSLAGVLLFALALAATAALVWLVVGRTTPASSDTPPAPATSQVDAVAELQRGVSLDHVRALLGQEPRHQFTARVGSAEHVCVSYAFGEPYARLYFLFKDGELEKIVEPPPFRYQSVPHMGARLEKRLPVEPYARIGQVVQAADLSGQDLRASLAARLPKGRDSYHVLPAFVANAPRFAADEPRRRREYERNDQLARHFDGRRVRLGDRREEVDNALGPPLQSAAAGAVCVYGSMEPLPRVNPAYRFSPVEVHFESGRAVAILGNDFVNTADGKTPKQCSRVSTARSAPRGVRWSLPMSDRV